MTYKKGMIVVSLFIVLTMMAACGEKHQTSPDTVLKPTPNTTTVTTPAITVAPCIPYTLSEDLNKKLQEAGESFGVPVPVMTCLSQGYAVSDISVNHSSESTMEADLTASSATGTDIVLSVAWWGQSGPFRILPSSVNYTSVDISGGPGKYSKAMLNYHDDGNALWWDWIPEGYPTQSLSPLVYYEFVLSAKKDVPAEELLDIARSVRILP